MNLVGCCGEKRVPFWKITLPFLGDALTNGIIVRAKRWALSSESVCTLLVRAGTTVNGDNFLEEASTFAYNI